MHHPTDILGAVVLAAGWLTVCYLTLVGHPVRSGHQVSPDRSGVTGTQR
jgi:hypothetical protein